ncbi:ABC transporter permease subunit [Zavarzinia sp. CC-PAN008]|uniref:ABC transporter permease subunit n=1 Tax=Zavarzinia sp. CC-PAN008 TaxID=3243332 RepID=UPI003F74A8ED
MAVLSPAAPDPTLRRRFLQHLGWQALRQAGSTPISVVSAGVLLFAWWLTAALKLVPPLFLPPPELVLSQAWVVATRGFADATLAEHAATSLMRVGSAFVIATSIAIPLGLAMGISRVAKGIFDPLIEFYWPLPPLAYLPLVIIWLGIGEVAKVTLITLAMFAPLCIAAQAGVRSVSAERIQAARTLGASRLQVLLHVILPGALPEVLTGVRIGVGTGWSVLVAAELVASTRGLGYMTLSAAHFLVTEVVFVGIFSIAFFAIGFMLAVRALERWLTPWKGRS